MNGKPVRAKNLKPNPQYAKELEIKLAKCERTKVKRRVRCKGSLPIMLVRYPLHSAGGGD